MNLYYVTGNVAGETLAGSTRDIEIRAMPQVARSKNIAAGQVLDWAEEIYGLADTRWIVGPEVDGGEWANEPIVEEV